MIKKILLVLLVLTPTITIAEDAPVCPAPKPNQGPWVNTFNFGYNKTSGNSDVSLLNLGFLSKYEKEEHLLRFQADHNFGETETVDSGEKQTNVDYSFVSGEYKNIVSEKLYLGLGTDFMRNEISDVKYRVLANPRVGYFIFKEDKVGSLDVYAGPSYLWEEVADETDDYLAPRLGNRFEYQLTETAKVFETLDVILSAESSDNYLVQGEAGIETKITDMLKLVFKVRTIYDNQPALGNDKNDLALLTGLGIDF